MAAYNYYTQYPYAPVPQQAPQSPSIVWVSSEYEAERYPVAPNNAVTLWSTTEPIVYLKQTDAAGRPTLKIYDLVERAATKAAPEEYAKQSDLAAVAVAVKDVNKLIGSIKEEIETMQTDLYGIRKKPVRKIKDTEEDE